MFGNEKEYAQSLLKLAILMLVLSVLLVSCGELDDEAVNADILISGKVTMASNSTAMASVNMNLTEKITGDVTAQLTATDGTYSFKELTPNRWYILEPSIGGYTFDPEQIQVYTNVNLTDANFRGTPN